MWLEVLAHAWSPRNLHHSENNAKTKKKRKRRKCEGEDNAKLLIGGEA